MKTPMTIDMLILSSMKDGEKQTPERLSKLLGEDRTRIHGFLESFRKRGIIRALPYPVGSRSAGKPRYVGVRRRIAEYLKDREIQINGN